MDCEQLDDPADEAGFFVQLAECARLRVLAEVDAAAGQRPGSRAERDVAQPAQQQSSRVVEADVVGRDALILRERVAHPVRSRRTGRRACRGTRPCPPRGRATWWQAPGSDPRARAPTP